MAELPELDRRVRDALVRPRPAATEADLPRTGVVGYEGSTWMYNLCRSTVRWLGTMFQDLKVYGQTNVPLSGGVLLVSNHQSYVDPAFIACKLPRALTFLAKSELFEPPVFGWGIRQCNAFPVRQGKGDREAVNAAIQLLRAGRAMLIFPEGSRSSDGEIAAMESGASLLVRRAKVPIVPVAIEGAFDVWPNSKPLPRTGRVRVKFGKPIAMHEMEKDEITQRIDREIRKLFGELREMRAAEVAALRMPPKRLGGIA